MVAQIRRHASFHPLSNQPPILNYSSHETLIGLLGVKSKLFGVRRRLVRLERSVLYVLPREDDYAQPLTITTLCEDSVNIRIDDTKHTISIRTEAPKSLITLVFKHDSALFNTWCAAITKAHRCTVETYYKFCALVGEGHYAKVYGGVDRKTGQKVAIKVMPKNSKQTKVMQYVKRESEIVRSISHPNIVRTLDVFETSSILYVVMEYVEKGTLLRFLSGGNNRVNENNARRIATQLLSAISYLHSNHIIHRDIKPENILITAKGTVKLADFGLARRIDGLASDEYCLSSILGTPAYCSPEVVSRSQYGKPVDIFGCGVLLYVAMSGCFPFGGTTPEQVFRNIAKGQISFPKKRWDLVSCKAKYFVGSLLSHRPGDRPTALEALNHPWLTGHGDRVNIKRAVSPRPFVRNASARLPKQKGSRLPAVMSTRSFRRAQSGSVDDLQRGRRDYRLSR